jgi:hypothetical protein
LVLREVLVSWVVERKMAGIARRRTRGGVPQNVDTWGVAGKSSRDVHGPHVAADVPHVPVPVGPLHVVVYSLEGPSWLQVEAAAS